MHVQAPLDLGPDQGPQPAQVDLPGPQLRGHGPGPAAERRLAGVPDRDLLPELLVPVPPTSGQDSPAGAAVAAVAAGMPDAQPQRGGGQVRADRHHAGPVARQRLFLAQPPCKIGVLAREPPVPAPPVVVPLAQQQVTMAGGPLTADLAEQLLRPGPLAHAQRGGHERGLADAALAVAGPLLLMRRAQVRAARAAPLAATDKALPAVDRVSTRDPDDVRTVDRVEGRAADQRGQDLQPVPAGPVTAAVEQRQQGIAARHRASPHTAAIAAPNAASCMST